MPGRDAGLLSSGNRSGKTNDEKLVGVGYRCVGSDVLSSFIMAGGGPEVSFAVKEALRGDGTVEQNEAREFRCSPVRPIETVRVNVDGVDFFAE